MKYQSNRKFKQIFQNNFKNDKKIRQSLYYVEPLKNKKSTKAYNTYYRAIITNSILITYLNYN